MTTQLYIVELVVHLIELDTNRFRIVILALYWLVKVKKRAIDK